MKSNGRRGFTTGPCGAAGVVTIWSICKLCEHCDDRGQSHTPQMVVIKRFVRINFCEFVLLARLSHCLTILSNPANPFGNSKVPGKKKNKFHPADTLGRHPEPFESLPTPGTPDIPWFMACNRFTVLTLLLAVVHAADECESQSFVKALATEFERVKMLQPLENGFKF